MLMDLDADFAALAPWSEALLRIYVGLALVPHALRNTFNMFPKTGQPHRSIAGLADYLDRQGYRPGKVWAPAISATQLICGPLLAVGLLTRIAAVPIIVFLLITNVERWRVGKYFCNQLGLEYTLMWVIAALYFFVHGSGLISLDHMLFGTGNAR